MPMKLSMLIAAIVCLITVGSATAQEFPSGQSAADSVRSVGARAPGNMVRAGVAQALNFGNAARAGIQITETSLVTSIRAQALADSIGIIFQQINEALVLFHNLLHNLL